MSESLPCFEGSCMCGAVKFEIHAAPVMQVMCHCADCRRYISGPFGAEVVFNPDTLHVTSGAEHIKTYNKTGRQARNFCDVCGTRLYNIDMNSDEHWTAVYAATLHDFKFEPNMHIQYAEKVMSIKDGLPKCVRWSGGETMEE